MQPIISGTTTERIIRTAILAILFSGYSVWLLRDGYITYPLANLQSTLKNKIGVDLKGNLPVVDTKLTASTVEQIPQNSSFDAMKKLLGEPHLKHHEQYYYFGEAGFLSVQVNASKKISYRWNPGPLYKPIDITMQRVFGISLIPVGLGLLFQFIRVIRTRVELSDAGLLVRGKPLIPMDQILFVVTPDTDKTKKSDDKIRIHYNKNDEEKILLMDAYVVKELPAMIETIQKQIDQRDSTGS